MRQGPPAGRVPVEADRVSLELPIYLDHQATTPCDPRVVEAMLPYFTREFGNPASRTHAFGWRAEQGVAHARGQVACLIGCDAREIVFTSGATEANNLALLGVMRAHRERGDHLVTLRTEHPSVLDPCRVLEKEGVRVTRLPVASDGLLDPAALAAALEPGTVLVSVMHANNEIGVLQPLAEIGRILRERDVLFHTDAAQSAGKLRVDVAALGVDLLSLSAHKLYGPKGIGALRVRRGTAVAPLLHGGGHERGLRSGTLPVPLCVGLGEACELASASLEAEAERLRALRERLWRRLQETIEGVVLNGHPEQRLPGNLNVSFAGVEAEALLMALPELALSTGAACSSARREPSHVLRELGLEEARAHNAVRIGLGRDTTQEAVDYAAGKLAEQVARLRAVPGRGRGAGRRRSAPR
jgi:cysteine desulfurase